MAWTAATFKVRWAEFNKTADAVVESALAEATRRNDPRLFGDKIDDAIGLDAADTLSLSPFGQQARLTKNTIDTTYRAQYERLARSCCGGPVAIGQRF